LAMAASASFAAKGKAAKSPKAPKSVSIHGRVVSVDLVNGGAFVVEAKGAQTPVTLAPDVEIVTKRDGYVEELISGSGVSILGKVAKDQSSIVATQIDVLPRDTKVEPSVSEKSLRGTLTKTGNELTVQVSLHDVAVKTTNATKVRLPEAGRMEDITAGADVLVRVTDSPADGKVAKRVEIDLTAAPNEAAKPAKPGAKKSKKK